MTYTFTFKNLTSEQENKFNEIIKSIPYDLVETFKEWADLMDVTLEVIAGKHITEIKVIGA